MKIIYFFELLHYYSHTYLRFQFETFLSKGYTVEVWSAVNWNFPTSGTKSDTNDSDFVYYINNEHDLNQNLIRISKEECYFLLYPFEFGGYNQISYLIRKNIKKNGFRYSNISMPKNLTGFYFRSSLFGKEIIFVRRLIKDFIHPFYATLKALIKSEYRKKYRVLIRNDIYRFLSAINYTSDYNFVPSLATKFNLPTVTEILSKKTILIHPEDYDKFQDNYNESYETEFIVFIDQFLTGHPDSKKFGQNYPAADSFNYFRRLRKLFSLIEKDYDCKVVIAAHPLAEYDGKEFGGRKIIKYKSTNLIKNAKFVLFQYSTILDAVTYYEKPFLNLYDEQFFENVPELKKDYRYIQRYFHNKQLNIADDEEIKKYKDYIYYSNEYYTQHNKDYVLSEESVGKDKLFFEVVYQYIEPFLV